MEIAKTVIQILEAVGSADNVVSVTHCATRLRFQLKDSDKVNDDEVKKIDGVLGTIRNAGGYQVIIGTDVPKYYQELLKQLPSAMKTEETRAEDKEADKRTLFNRFLSMIMGIIGPYLPLFLTYGVINGVITLLASFGIMDSASATYQIFYAMAQAVIYFFPIYLGYTAAKQFGGDPYVGAVIGGVLVYPNVIPYFTNGAAFEFLGINVTGVTYSGGVLPIVIAMLFFSFLDKFLRKYMPKVISFLMVPIIDVVVTVSLTVLVIGPISNAVAEVLLAGYEFLQQFNIVLFTMVCGGFYMLLVLTGLHWILFPFQLQYLTETGMDYCFPAASLSLWTLVGLGVAVFLVTKDEKLKQTSLSAAAVAAISGISEPLMYGVMLRDKVYIAIMIVGGLAGGFICGIFDCYNIAFGAGGFLGLPGYMGMPRFGIYLACLIGTILFGFVSTLLYERVKKGYRRKK